MTPADKDMGKLAGAYRVSSGLSGDPNGARRPAWPRYHPAAARCGGPVRPGRPSELDLQTINSNKVTRIDVADNSVDLILYLWQRNRPYPHNIDPKPLVAGVDRRPPTT
jgi:hypothetical protein